MALERILDTLDGLNEVVAAEYSKGEDGKFHLSVNGDEDVTGLKANNKTLIEEKRNLQKQMEIYKDLGDPTKAKEALAKLRKMEEDKLIAEGDVEKIIAHRTENMRQDHTNQVKALAEMQDKITAENGKLKAHLNRVVIERGILDAANVVGQPKKEALIDIIARGNQTWHLDDDGNPIPKNPDGSIIYGKDGKAPMTMEEWAAKQMETAPHLWLESKGGGARGSLSTADGRKLSPEELASLSPMAKARLATERGLRKQATA